LRDRSAARRSRAPRGLEEYVMTRIFDTKALVPALALMAAAALCAPRASAAGLAPADQAFADDAAHAGLEEVALGRAAQDRAATGVVRDFASRMVTDHEKANAQLEALAQRRGFALPDRPDGNAEKSLAELQGAHGARFDAEYMEHQVSDHRKVVAEFEREARRGGDADLRRFASDTLPTLRTHLALAQETERRMPGTDREALREQRGLDAAKAGTGASRVATEHNDRTTVEETGM
jgi:putative membrane protein